MRGRKGYYSTGNKKDKKYYMAQRKKEREERLKYIDERSKMADTVEENCIPYFNPGQFRDIFLNLIHQFSKDKELKTYNYSMGLSNHIARFLVNPSVLPLGKRTYGDSLMSNVFSITDKTKINTFNDIRDVLFEPWQDTNVIGAVIPGKIAILKIIGYCKANNINVKDITYDYSVDNINNPAKALAFIVDCMISSLWMRFSFNADITINVEDLTPKIRYAIASSLLNLVGILDLSTIKTVVTGSVISILLTTVYIDQNTVDKWYLPTDYIEGMFSFSDNYEKQPVDETKISTEDDDNDTQEE